MEDPPEVAMETDPEAENPQQLEEGQEQNDVDEEGTKNSPPTAMEEDKEVEEDNNNLTEENPADSSEEGSPENKISMKIEKNNNSNVQVDLDTGKRKRSASHSSNDEGPRRKQGRNNSTSSAQRQDSFCWVCHREKVQLHCKICPRAYHFKCMNMPEENTKDQPAKSCVCSVCQVVLDAENLETRSESMKQLTVDQLITMLKYACQRMKSLPGVDDFLYPVDPTVAVDYFKYIVNPMDICTLEDNVKQRQYGCTEAFLADAQWLVHNSVIFNSSSSPFTTMAKRILKTCKQEVQEIETCPECYVNAHNKPTSWFVEACKRPHVLVWAKLKGFPFWPGKAMKVKDDTVDVRFFGQHDRAWVSKKDCFLLSEEMPGGPPKRNNQLGHAMEELNTHISKLEELHGKFAYASTKTPFDPSITVELIRQMLPEYKPEDSPSKKKSNVQQLHPTKAKSPMTIKISSLKTNPTIVNNSVAEDSEPKKPLIKIKNSSEPVDDAPVEKEANNVPASVETKKETDDKPVSVPSTGILASVLEGRSGRRNSKSETSDSDSNSVDRRVTRSRNKTESSESGATETKMSEEPRPPPPDAFLQSIGLCKTSDLKVKIKTGEHKSAIPPTDVVVKGEPDDSYDTDNDNEMEGDTDSDSPRIDASNIKNQELVSQLSGTGNTAKRFILSKDISISPVNDDATESKMEVRQRRPLLPGHSARLLPGLIPQMGGSRSRHPIGNGPVQRMTSVGTVSTARMPSRSVRPVGPALRPSIKIAGPRPLSIKPVPKVLRDGSPVVVDSSTMRVDGTQANAVQLSQVQSLQGAITLPGGTITVTPLAPVIGVPITTSAYTATDGTVNGTQDGSNQSILKPIKTPAHRKNLMNLVPSTVGHLVQNLQKTLAENVKTTMEQIIVEMLESQGNLGGTDAKSLKDENERLKKQLQEQRHNHEISVREIKLGLENEKKRALSEQRRQMEQERFKAVEETKKKQWCARCGREAQFYWERPRVYSCWNTSYCGYPCQEEHWPTHMNSCSQNAARN